jgi:hypothetical protein
MAAPTVTFGDPVLAAGLDGILAEADRKLSVLFGGGRSWFAFTTADLPSHQIPLIGIPYVLTADAKRVLTPAVGTNAGTFFWPSQYVHADHLAAGNALTLIGSDAQNVAWEVSGTYVVAGYAWGECAAVLERSVTGEVRPLRLTGSWEPERFQRYAIADVIVEDDALSAINWLHDKCGIVRFHNLGRQSVAFNLADSVVVTVPARGCRTIRRTSRSGAWDVTTRHYLPRCLPEDIPICDGAPTGWANLVLQSQVANPIFRQVLLQTMFRPHPLTHGPGLFSNTVLDVRGPVDPTGKLAELLADHGTVDAVRTSTLDANLTQVFPLGYAGNLSTTPPDWAACGLAVSLDNTQRAAVVSPDAAFPPPTDGVTTGAWRFDLISRSTNITGGIVVAVNPSRVLRPWFSDAAGADAWFAAMFLWPTWPTTAALHQQEIVDVLEWTPDAFGPSGSPEPNPDPDYFGTWASVGPTVTHRSYTASFGSAVTGTVSAWNLYSNSIASSLPAGGPFSAAVARRQVILTAVVLTETLAWWHADDDPVYDNAGPIDPTDGGLAPIHLENAGGPIGFGAPAGPNQWAEQRFSLYLLPTIGFDPQQSWECFGFSASEEIIWTPLHRDLPGAGTICHFRTRAADGAAGGAPWYWSYTSSAELPPTHEAAPTSTIGSAMRFWRVFWMGTKQPGGTTPYPGRPRNGPHPWPIRDHGWLANEILAGTPNAAGEPWSLARRDCYDLVDIGGSVGGTARGQEGHVGMQFRMGAAGMHNQLAALVNGITHVRPLGWPEYCDGFRETDLVESAGWALSDALVQASLPGLYLQPFGAAHIYGFDSSIDGKLDGLGITRRTAECPELQAMATVTCLEYTLSDTDGYQRTPFAPALEWSSLGGEIEWCSHEDIWQALNSRAWEWRGSCLVQPVSLTTLIPGAAIETVTDTSAANSSGFPWFHSRPRFRRTQLVAIPDGSDGASYQISLARHNRMKIAAERTMPAQVLSRRASVSSPWPADFRADIVRIGETTGAVWDAIHRVEGLFQGGDAGSGEGRYIFWSARLLAPEAFADDWKVVAVPWRRMVHHYTADDTGPRVYSTFSGDVGDWPIILPEAAPIVWLSVSTGGLIDITDLPEDDLHTWELIVRPRGLKAL